MHLVRGIVYFDQMDLLEQQLAIVRTVYLSWSEALGRKVWCLRCKSLRLSNLIKYVKLVHILCMSYEKILIQYNYLCEYGVCTNLNMEFIL